MADQFLTKIHRIIEENMGNELFSVEDLAKEVGLSRSMVHRKLVKLTGQSAGDLITEIRLNKARELLEKNAGTASEIAYRVGFNSPSYFNKVFKKHFKVSPGDVKKNSRVKTENADTKIFAKNDGLSGKRFRIFKRSLFIIFLIVILSGAATLYFLGNNNNRELSIAVLPLQNLTGESANDYFVDGMHDALIGELSQFSSLRVISRTSTLRYRDPDMLMQDIAQELGVNTIVEGSVSKIGDSVRVLIQLINVYPDEGHIMAEEYNDNIRNVLHIHSNVVKDIAREIDVKFTDEEAQLFAKTRAVNPESYKAFLRGMYHMNKGTAKGFIEGLAYLEDAIERDPADPFAYAGLALGYATVGHGQIDSEETFNRAMAAAQKAIKLDPTIDEAYTALSLLCLYYLWDWPRTKESFEEAIRKNPNNEIAHAHFAWYHILFEEMDKSIYHAKMAVEIDPFSAAFTSWLALLYWYDDQLDNAEIWARKALNLNDKNPYGNLTLGLVNLKRKNYPDAIQYFEKLPEDNGYVSSLRGYGYVKSGQKNKALKIWNALEEISKKQYVNPCYLGWMASYLGYHDLAFKYLNEAVDHKVYPISYIKFFPCTEDLEYDPRYSDLLARMKLEVRKTILTSK